MKSKFTILLCLFGLIFQAGVSSRVVIAQADANPKTTPQQERTALRFAKKHHSELAHLLLLLKEMDPKKYDSAVLELSRTAERLEKIRPRLPERYQTDLELWKIDSRVKLLVARSAKGMELETREQIKQLLMKRNSIRLDQFTQERERLVTRMQRLDDQISNLKVNQESLADQDLDRLMRTVSRLSKGSSKLTPNSELPDSVKSKPIRNKQNKTKSNTNFSNP